MRYSLMPIVAALAIAGAAPALAANPLSATGFAVTGSIPGPDGYWDLLAIDATSHRLFVGHGERVMSVDLDTGKVNSELARGQHIHAAVPLPGGHVLYTDGEANTATIIDAQTGEILATIPTGADPDNAILDPVTGLVLVMDHDGGDVTLVDPETMTSPGRISVGGELEQGAADGHGKVYVNMEDKAQVAVIDTVARKVSAYYDLPGCEGPSGFGLDPDRGVLITACENETAVALHASDGSVAATLKIGKGPDGTVFDAARKLFFVPCGRDGVLTVVSETEDGTLEVVANVPTAVGARTATLDTKTGKLYLPTADFDFKNTPAGQRPKLVPGSFRILVVGAKS